MKVEIDPVMIFQTMTMLIITIIKSGVDVAKSISLQEHRALQQPSEMTTLMTIIVLITPSIDVRTGSTQSNEMAMEVIVTINESGMVTSISLQEHRA